LTDPGFLVDRNIALGAVDSECEAEEFDSGVLIKRPGHFSRDLSQR